MKYSLKISLEVCPYFQTPKSIIFLEKAFSFLIQ